MTFKSVPVRLAGPLFLCLLLLGQAGCFQRHDRADFTVINGPDPEALDPAIITSQADGRIVSAMFEGLTRFNAVTAQAEPALAKRWEISDDGTVYTFHLRENLRWSTGEPITAADVVVPPLAHFQGLLRRPVATTAAFCRVVARDAHGANAALALERAQRRGAERQVVCARIAAYLQQRVIG